MLTTMSSLIAKVHSTPAACTPAPGLTDNLLLTRAQAQCAAGAGSQTRTNRGWGRGGPACWSPGRAPPVTQTPAYLTRRGPVLSLRVHSLCSRTDPATLTPHLYRERTDGRRRYSCAHAQSERRRPVPRGLCCIGPDFENYISHEMLRPQEVIFEAIPLR